MNAREHYRLALALAVLAIASPVFGLSHGSNTNFVLVHGVGAVVFVVIGLVALAGALLQRAAVVVAAGIGAAVAAVVQLVQFGRGTNWLEGNGATFALFLGLALGLVVIGLTVPRGDVASGDGHAGTLEGVS